jgi:hypothetical protein
MRAPHAAFDAEGDKSKRTSTARSPGRITRSYIASCMCSNAQSRSPAAFTSCCMAAESMLSCTRSSAPSRTAVAAFAPAAAPEAPNVTRA